MSGHPEYPIRHGVPAMDRCKCGGVLHWHAAAPYGCDDCDCAGFVLDEDWRAPEREPAQDEVTLEWREELVKVGRGFRRVWRIKNPKPSQLAGRVWAYSRGGPVIFELEMPMTSTLQDGFRTVELFQNFLDDRETLSRECPTNHFAPDGKAWDEGSRNVSGTAAYFTCKFCPDCGAPLDDPKGEKEVSE